ncbi:MAG: diacylglycerol kinase family protein [Planctomycetota bacterium]
MDARPHILIIVNPKSGRGKAEQKSKRLAEILQQRGRQVRIEPTRGRGDAERIAFAAIESDRERPTCIVACGGDGIISEIAHVLATARSSLGDQCPTMALAPAGRCNDFAKALRVPQKRDVIASLITNGVAKPIDLGWVNGRHFCTVAAFGIDAAITRYVDTTPMPLRGTPAYLVATLRVLKVFAPPTITIEGPFGRMERQILVASVANTPTYGGAIPIAPQADATDGQLDICLIDPVSKFRILTLLPRILLGRHSHQPEVLFLRTSKLTLESSRPLEIWSDGEPISSTPATIQVVPAALRVMLPN